MARFGSTTAHGSVGGTGVVQGRTIGHAAQLGGVLVIRPGGTVAWSHMSEDASDNARPEEILAALERAAG